MIMTRYGELKGCEISPLAATERQERPSLSHLCVIHSVLVKR